MAAGDTLPITTMINMTPIKLDSTNYLSWRRQIIHMVSCFDLTSFLDPSATVPAATITDAAGVESPNPSFTVWKMKDMKLLSVIYTSLSSDAASDCIDATSSLAAWTTLASVYSSSSRHHQLREELLSLRRGESTVDDYGRKFKALCDQLHAIAKPIDEAEKSHLFLRGLGLQFAGFADTRMALTPVPCFRDLLSQAKQYDLMLKSMEGSPSQVSFYADRRTPPPSQTGNQGGRGSDGGRSFTGSRGRRRFDQRGGRPDSGGRFSGNSSSGFNSERRQFVPRCQICRGEHYADRCPRYLALCDGVPAANLAEAFTSSCNVSELSSDWFIDSGASAHITNQNNALSSYKPYSGNNQVVVGNESSDKSNSGPGTM